MTTTKVRLTQAQTSVLEQVNRGLDRSPPLPRATLDALLKRGLVRTARHPRGYQAWRITDEGKDALQ